MLKKTTEFFGGSMEKYKILLYISIGAFIGAVPYGVFRIPDSVPVVTVCSQNLAYKQRATTIPAEPTEFGQARYKVKP